MGAPVGEIDLSDTGLYVADVVSWLVMFVFALADSALREFSKTKFEAMLESRGKRNPISDYDTDLAAMSVTCVVFSALGTIFLAALLVAARPDEFAAMASLAVLFALVLGLLPARAVGQRWPEGILLVLLPVLSKLSMVFAPALRALHLVRHAWVGTAPNEDEDTEAADLADEILSAAEEGEKEGVLEESQKEMIEGIFELRDAEVSQIMTPRTEMVGVELSASLAGALETAVEVGMSRFPVYKENRDHIVGILYAKDLLRCSAEERMREGGLDGMMRKPYFVPETKKISELLQEFQSRKVHIAIVVDEYGGTAGLVTIEDVVEEIVGEIQDEFEKDEEAMVTLLDDGTYEVDSRLHMDELNEALKLNLPEDEEYDTLGGFVFSLLGKVPQNGDTFEHDGAQFEILKADARHVERLRLDVGKATARTDP